jgi:uncharacterized protein (TIGR00159 family)
MAFLEFRLIDFIDIVLVAFLMYRFYMMVRGTIALNILIGLFAFVIFWLTVKALKMDLSASILDNFVNVGVLALIVVFQQEIRRFFLQLGTKYKLLGNTAEVMQEAYLKPLLKSCENLSKTKTGALIVIGKETSMNDFIETGELLNADISSQLIESIFFKNSPLHDGAIIITRNKIRAASCILPVSQNFTLPKHMGLRHRAAMGISETSDAGAIVVSEETGRISFFNKGNYESNLTISDVERILQRF